MIQVQTRLALALTAAGLGGMVVGCGGGSSGGITAPAPPASGNVSLEFSDRENAKVPREVFASNLKGKFIADFSRENVRVAFDDVADTGAFNLQFSKFTSIGFGDSFSFSGKKPGEFTPYETSLTYSFDGETFRARRGTVLVTNSPTSSEDPYTLRFSLIKVEMQNTQDESSSFELSGNGEVRLPHATS